MKKLYVNAGAGYEILIERGLVSRAGEFVANAVSAEKIAVISDSNVAPLYLETVENSLKKSGFETVSYVLKQAKAQKTQKHLLKLLNFSLRANLQEMTPLSLSAAVCAEIWQALRRQFISAALNIFKFPQPFCLRWILP